MYRILIQYNTIIHYIRDGDEDRALGIEPRRWRKAAHLGRMGREKSADEAVLSNEDVGHRCIGQTGRVIR